MNLLDIEPRYQQNENYPVDSEAWGPKKKIAYQVPQSHGHSNYRNTNGTAKTNTSQRNTKSDDAQKSSLCDWGVPTASQR